MKKALLVSFCLLFVLSSLAMARPATKGNSLADYNIDIYNDQMNKLPGDLFTAAQADTYWLANYSFDSGGTCAAQGWYSRDLTAQPGTMFHVDTYRVITGNQSMWCGARVSASEPWCSYASLPGYGNGWNQTLTSRVFTVLANSSIVMDYHAVYDSEPGYDYTYFQYKDAGGVWQDLETYTGDYDSTVTDLAVPKMTTTSVQMRFWFESDGAWSDEDGLWNTSGAIVLDDFSVDDVVNSVNVDNENWEGEAINATQSSDLDWVGAAGPGFGDYAGLFPGVAVLQQDKCTQDLTCLWGFFKGSTDDYSCATPIPHPEQLVIPYENALGQFFNNEIWSPWIDLTGGGLVPAGAAANLEFRDYRNRPLANLIFMVWHVRSRLGLAGCPGSWADRNFVYYGPGPDWLQVLQPVTDLITPGDDQIQLAIGAVDMCSVWCPKYGNGDCHSHSPLIDKVKFYRVATTGPRFSVRDIDMFQDNFPEDGTLTGTVRIDAAIDRMPTTTPNIYPGDSAIFNVSEASVGLGTGGNNGRADVYCYVKSNFMGANQPAIWEAPEVGVHAWNAVRYPYMGGGATAGGFYKFQCDTSYQDVEQTNATPDKFAFDLDDAYFTPPARIDFYFSAVDANANTIYWTPWIGHTLVQAEAEAQPDEVQCLPTGDSDILFVDNQSDRGGQGSYFYTAFDLMGVTPDTYDKRGPSSLVANGIGARAAFAQVTNVYQKILYDTGDLGRGLVGGGWAYSPEKSEDAQLLYNFLDQTTAWNPGVYLCGDDVAQEMKTLNNAPYLNLFYFINYNVLSGDHVATGLPIAPLTIGSTVGSVANGYIFQHGAPAYGDTIVAYGGCPLINDFEVLEATGFSVEAMYYQTAGNGAVLTQARANAQGKTARFVLSGFSFVYIRDDRVQFPHDRLDHLLHIVRWFENPIDDPTGAGDTPLVTSLSQNYPNPFNPTTTIEFSLKENAHVSLKVYNVAGQLVRTLADKDLDAGVYKNYTWDGLDNSNQPVASGVYFYKLVTKNFNQTRKMVLLK